MKPELPTALKQFQHEVVFYAENVELEALSLAICRWEYTAGRINEVGEWVYPILSLHHKLTPEAAKEIRELALVGNAAAHIVFQDTATVPMFRHEFTFGDLALVPGGCSNANSATAEGCIVCLVKNEVFYAVVPSADVESDIEL